MKRITVAGEFSQHRPISLTRQPTIKHDADCEEELWHPGPSVWGIRRLRRRRHDIATSRLRTRGQHETKHCGIVKETRGQHASHPQFESGDRRWPRGSIGTATILDTPHCHFPDFRNGAVTCKLGFIAGILLKYSQEIVAARKKRD